MKRIAFAGAIIACLGLGYVLSNYYERENGRVAFAIYAFETHCVPFAFESVVVPRQGWIKERLRGGATWVHTENDIELEMTRRFCRVSDVNFNLSKRERRKLSKRFAHLVNDRFPMLEAETGTGFEEWDQFLMWSQYAPRHPGRWGATLARWQNTGENSSTSMSLRFLGKIPGLPKDEFLQMLVD